MQLGLGLGHRVAATPSGGALEAEGPNGMDRRRRIFLLGTGFVARHVSIPLLLQGWHVSGTCTTSLKKNQLRTVGIDAHLFDANRHKLTELETLRDASHVLVSIPPAYGIGDPVSFFLSSLLHFHISLSKAFTQTLSLCCVHHLFLHFITLSALYHMKMSNTVSTRINRFNFPLQCKIQLLNLHHELHPLLNYGNLQWLCYLSSTSVYGDCGGTWVDEDYPVNPRTESAKSRYEAEKGWTNFGLSLGLSTFIFRLGGYGPGRSALDTLMRRKDLSENQKRRDSRDFYYTARVHVADICQTILSSIANPYLGKIYNVVDDDPAPRAEVFAFARDLISQRYPEMVSDFNHVSLGDLQAIIGEKCVSNTRMKEELGVQLIYPSYKSGLQSIFDSWSSSL